MSIELQTVLNSKEINSFLLTPTYTPQQQKSVITKDYLESAVLQSSLGKLTILGEYNALLNTPDLDGSPIAVAKGGAYHVVAEGDLFSKTLFVGDLIIAKVDDPTSVSDWIILNGITKIDGNKIVVKVKTTLIVPAALSIGEMAYKEDTKVLYIGTTSGVEAITPELDIDPTLAADSDTVIASQKAVKAYVDNAIVSIASFDEILTANGSILIDPNGNVMSQ